MDVATIKKDLENQIGDINKELKNIYLPLEAVLILLGKRTAFQIALELIDSLQQEQKPAGWNDTDTENLTWQQLCRIIETAFRMLNRNLTEAMMCSTYNSPQEFCEELKKKLEQ